MVKKQSIPHSFQDYSIYESNKNPKTGKADLRGFKIDEETSSKTGSTYGSYGYIDQKGDLHYVEYTKDKNGML